MRCLTRLPLHAAALLLAMLAPAAAEDAWNPFARPDARIPKAQPPPPADVRPPLAPMGGVYPGPGRPDAPGPAPYQPPAPGSWQAPAMQGQPLPPPGAKDVVVSDLPPPGAADGTGLPADPWAGLDMASLERLIGPLARPDRSVATMDLWRRLWRAGGAPAAAKGGAEHFDALRIEALYRSGLIEDMTATINGIAAGRAGDPLLDFLLARGALIEGNVDGACERARDLGRGLAELPESMRGHALILAAYCGARGGNTAAAGLAAELLRDANVEATVPLAVLDAMAAKGEPGTTLPRTVTVLDLKFLELARAPDLGALVERAEPALLALLARSAGVPAVRAAAAEAAARINALDAKGLAAAYLAAAEAAGTSSGSPALRRAVLVAALEREADPVRKARAAAELVADAARSGLIVLASRMVGDAFAAVRPDGRLAAEAETITASLVAAGRFREARAWAAAATGPGGRGQSPWLALADIADPTFEGPRGAALESLDELARAGRLPAEFLHRLVTVLDALDYQIPIPLWEAASRTAQPNTGHLPATGVLSELQSAAERKETARTILLALTALGPNGIEGAHMLSLGDAIKALKRAGLEGQARQIAFEALFAGWPRQRPL